MPISKERKEFVSYIVDLMQTIGPVHAKCMFGGHGIFLEGLMFGLIDDNILYLKADEDSRCNFTDKGLEAFTYYKKGRPMQLSYYQAPEDALEDVDQMQFWANMAYSVALRAAAKKHK